MINKKFVISTLAAFALVAGFSVASAVTATEIYTPASGFLKVGSGYGAKAYQNANVKAAQTALNACTPGMNLVIDGKFGPLTEGKFKTFQASKAIMMDGVIGPVTAGQLAACSGDMDDDSDNDSSLNGGETSIEDISLDDADDTSVKEGQSKVEVASLEFDVEDADAKLVRADIVFDGTGNDEEDPWDTFDKVYLMDGSKTLASMDSDSKDDWDETSTDDVYRVRFTGINAVFNEGDRAELTVVVDLASSIDGVDDGEDWTVSVDDNGLRFTDGAGLDTEDDTSDTADFTIEESGAQSDITVTQDTTSPDAGTLEVDGSSSTTQTIAIFKVKADEDGGDIKLLDFPIELTIGSTTTGDDMAEVVDDVYIVVDGTTYSTDDSASATDATQTFSFGDLEDDDVVIDAGDDMKVTVKVKFKSQNNGVAYANATTIAASTDLDTNDFEDADTGDDINTVDDADGETMQLYSEGVSVSDFSSSKSTNSDDDGLTTTVNYTITYKVTAFGDDFYIPKTVVRGTTSSTAGLLYTVEDGSGSVTTTAGASASQLTSSADTVSSYFEVADGETETFTVNVTVTLGTDGADYYRVQLGKIGYDTDQSGTVTNLDLTPAQDYETDQVSIQA